MDFLMQGAILLVFYIILDSFFNGIRYDDLNKKIRKLEIHIKEMEEKLDKE
ncbi:MAG: hypothetical protein JJT76_19605 [Clostridiaceae bacterium]|nr:hypothetical protein [Clostridiaceae bacterium]